LPACAVLATGTSERRAIAIVRRRLAARLFLPPRLRPKYIDGGGQAPGRPDPHACYAAFPCGVDKSGRGGAYRMSLSRCGRVGIDRMVIADRSIPLFTVIMYYLAAASVSRSQSSPVPAGLPARQAACCLVGRVPDDPSNEPRRHCLSPLC